MKPVWIELVNSGIANRFEFSDHELIEMNWRLTEYPDLYYNVLQHELSHQDGDYKTKDFLHDMKSTTPGIHKFMLNHISAWKQILPIYWDMKRKTIVYDWSAIISWWLLIATVFVVYYLIGWINYIASNGVW